MFALWFQAAVSLVLMASNTYDQLLSYVVFADWLFFGLTAGALFVVRARGGIEPANIFKAPGHPISTGAFILVAVGVVINSFFVYPTQSLIGTAILTGAAIVYVVMPRAKVTA